MRALFLFLFTLTILCSCNTNRKSDPLDKSISVSTAQSDFKRFRDLLEEGHPALTEYITAQRKNFLFDSVYKSIDESISLREFFRKLTYISNEIQCSHTYVDLPSAALEELKDKKLFFPIPLILLNSGLYANSDELVPPGTKILMINTIPVDRILDSLMKLNPVEGKHRQTQRYQAASDFGYEYYQEFGGFKNFEVLIKDTLGKISTMEFDAIDLDELRTRSGNVYYFDAMDVPYSLSINRDASYAEIRLTKFTFDSQNQERAFEDFLRNSFELLSKTEIRDLIIDVRENRGGDLYYCFLLYSYLAEMPFSEYTAVYSKIKEVPDDDLLDPGFDDDDLNNVNNRLKKDFTRSTAPGFWLPDSLIDKWEPNSNHFQGNVYVITNSGVASAASYFTLLAKHSSRAKIVGMETSGGPYSGNGFKTLEYRLPLTDISVEFAYAKMYYSFPGTKAGGIVPDYVVPDDYASFRKNQDRQLNFVIDSLILKNR
jgi:hypothetical protein